MRVPHTMWYTCCMDICDRYWLAGILEGEGCIYYTSGHLRVSCEMTDQDVVERVAKILGTTVSCSKARREGWKDTYRCSISGDKAVLILSEIYQIMGTRRQSKITEVIGEWNDRSARRQKRYDKEAVINDFNSGISISDAIKKYGFGKTTALRYKRLGALA